MIKRASDLVGYYALRSDTEIFELFMQKCEQFCINWAFTDSPRGLYEFEAVRAEPALFLRGATEDYYIKNGLKKIQLSDLIDLENSKVYTNDEEVIRKYSELCGGMRELSDECVSFDDEYNNSIAGYCSVKYYEFKCSPFSPSSSVANGCLDYKVHEITPEQINALYAEKFGGTDIIDWQSGDKCVYRENGAVVIAYHPVHPVIVIDSDEYGLRSVTPGELRKPETEAERNERERLEAAYYLYCTCGVQHQTVSFDEFKEEISAAWLNIVDKTGYRRVYSDE